MRREVTLFMLLRGRTLSAGSIALINGNLAKLLPRRSFRSVPLGKPGEVVKDLDEYVGTLCDSIEESATGSANVAILLPEGSPEQAGILTGLAVRQIVPYVYLRRGDGRIYRLNPGGEPVDIM